MFIAAYLLIGLFFAVWMVISEARVAMRHGGTDWYWYVILFLLVLIFWPLIFVGVILNLGNKD